MTHIFLMNISDIDETAYQRLYDCSATRRKERADRYLRREDRIRCVAAGALLQLATLTVLGKRNCELEYSPLGKPRLRGEPDFHFNLSHSGDWVVLAYASYPVGIDVERIQWNSGKEKLARHYFTTDEQDYVFGQGERGTAERFFEIWTAKESYLKYLGTGLRKALNSFSVLQLRSPNRFSIQPEDGYSLSLWTEDEAFQLKRLPVSELQRIMNKNRETVL